MSDRDAQPDELRELLAAWCDGSLPPHRAAELERRLLNDEAAADAYLRMADLHAELSLRCGGLRPAQQIEAATEPIAVAGRIGARGIGRIGSIAAAVAVVGIAAAAYFTAAGHKLVAPDIAPAPVGVVLDADGVMWDSKPIAAGESLTRGPLTIASGSVGLSLNRGTELTLVGPIDCRFESAERVRLNRGTISATVSVAARGFTVRTPRFDLVDLGTAFTLSVADDGLGIVAVTTGRVELRRTGQDPVPLVAGQVAWVEADGSVHAPDGLATATDRLELQRGVMAAQLGVGDSLVAWYRADLGVVRDDTGHVTAWRGLASDAPDAVPTGADSMPTWTSAVPELADRPAIRFDGGDRLVTDLVPALGAAPRTIIAVVVDRDADDAFGGYRHVAHWGTDDITPAHSQTYGLVTRTVAIQTGGVRSFGNHYWGVGMASSHSPDHDPHVLVVSYDGKTDRLWVDGELVGRNTVALNTGDKFGLAIGSIMTRQPIEGFVGDIAELIVLDAAITGEQRERIQRQLSGRYGLSMKPEQEQDQPEGDPR